jgi:hypothetical protein
MMTKAEAGLREAQKQLDASVASGRRNGQDAIVDRALAELAERRARPG